MSVAYVIAFDVRPGRRERFLERLTGVLDAMRHEATFRSATLHEDPENPQRFLLHEVWSDHDDVVTVQMARPYRRAWHAALPDLLAADRQIGIWRPIANLRSGTPALRLG
ncbi:putative quinol monooxygenase [Aurantimonas sp. A2-1-M11]|uniref:putative quinol monooxygenase n=1 Tax=Aurantimonas sp. A2-1-M11 TaxID=3113712 RepID=UPI002F95AA59